MFNQMFDRQIGGSNKVPNRVHNFSWKNPQPTPDVFLERFETASFDQISLARFTDGLPITCQFGRESSSSYLCAVTDEDGLVQIFDTRPGVMARGLARVKGWRAHDNAVFDYQWINGDTQCLTSSGDQTVVLWDVEKAARVTTFRGHDCSVRSVAPCPGSPAQCASGARDGHIMLWDCRVNKKHDDCNWPEKSIKYAHSLTSRAETRRHRRNTRSAGPKGVMDTQQSVTCVLYQRDNLLISSGANDGCVKFWDTRKWYSNSISSLPIPVQTFEYPGQTQRLKGIVTMCMDPWRSQLFVSYTDNRVYRFDITGLPKKPAEYVYAGHRNDTFYVRCAVSPDGNYLLSGSGKNTGVIWEVDKPQKQPVFLIGHTQDVSAVDWCPTDLCKLATLSDDLSLRVWRPDPRGGGVEDPNILGFAYSARQGRQCSRQARVTIIQDEFPFRMTAGSSKPQAAEPSPGTFRLSKLLNNSQSAKHKPAAVSSPGKLSASASPVPPAHQKQSASSSPVQSACRTPKRSPRKAPSNSSPIASSSGQSLWGPSEHLTPPPSFRRRLDVSGNYSDGENMQGRLSSRRVNFTSPPGEGSCGSVVTSPCTPQNNASPLPFTAYRSPLAMRKNSGSSESDFDPQPPAAERVCLKSIDTNSPSKESQRPLPRASPRKKSSESPLKSPNKSPSRISTKNPFRSPSKSPSRNPVNSPLRRSPRKRVSEASLVAFSSPTANLPNSVLDGSLRISPIPRKEKKIDWLTSYRRSKGETLSPLATSPAPKSSPGGANRKLFESDSATTPGKDSGVRNITLTPKRKSARLSVHESDDVTPRKRIRIEGPITPGSSGKKNVARRSGTAGTPKRKNAAAASPQIPRSNSILRYLQ
ncbi:denticleless protein homolog [Littorina saxatilis]|uniref:Denticleless protein homolog n=1 Tax=Littorina saxatilis TaxID=31220 RepID=A0AAN9GDV4_9CAEN